MSATISNLIFTHGLDMQFSLYLNLTIPYKSLNNLDLSAGVKKKNHGQNAKEDDLLVEWPQESEHGVLTGNDDGWRMFGSFTVYFIH